MLGKLFRVFTQSPDGLLHVNVQGLSNSFKFELMLGLHQLGAVTLTSRTSLTAPTKDVVKAALYLVTASPAITAAIAAYTATGEVSSSGTNYPAGGVTVTNAVDPVGNGTAGVWTPSATISYPAVTLVTAFDCVMLYNSSQSNRSISIHTFGSQTITAGAFGLSMPANTAGNALVQIT